MALHVHHANKDFGQSPHLTILRIWSHFKQLSSEKSDIFKLLVWVCLFLMGRRWDQKEHPICHLLHLDNNHTDIDNKAIYHSLASCNFYNAKKIIERRTPCVAKVNRFTIKLLVWKGNWIKAFQYLVCHNEY